MQKISSVRQFILEMKLILETLVTAIFDHVHPKKILAFLAMYEQVKNEPNSFIHSFMRYSNL